MGRLVPNRASMTSFTDWGHGQAAGVQCTLGFAHSPPNDLAGAATGSGALVATRRGAVDIENEWRRLSSPPVVVDIVLFIAESCDALTTPTKDTNKNNIKINKIDFSIFLLILSPPL